ncbi:Transposase [Thermanaeromonas toyohensis ToBE]|uniref:Transposase n=1 Tax=Thermanaeromonas toyohensis ToBE TaxID=698762 RepID=A0A1W1VAJ5_9FIRM|nr:ISL3 family transposase [Thermanaeromonas toyohensis]SMB90233.1 Transposase [Thermanaeromonas toyohensis ToBE]
MHKISTFTLEEQENFEKILQPILEEPQDPGDIVLKVTVDPPEVCPVCNEGKLHRHGFLKENQKPKERRIRHAFLYSRWVILLWVPVRYKCYRCGKTYTLRPPGTSPWARFTKLGVQTVVYYAQRMSFTYAAQMLNLTPTRVIRLVDKYVQPNLPFDDTQEPIVLTLDELSFTGNDFVCMVGRLEPDKRPLTILEDVRTATIKAYLEELKKAGVKVEAVVIDMKDSWRKLIKAIFPSAKIIVDPFHVIQDANRRLDEARRIEQEASKEKIPRFPLIKAKERLTPRQQEALEKIKDKYPSLYELYQLKEDLRQILRMDRVEEAKAALSRWFINAECAENAEGRIWARTIKSWRSEILNLVRYTQQGRRYTNGYIEGKNTLSKMLKRLSFGFRNRIHFIKKIFLGCCPQNLIPQLLT